MPEGKIVKTKQNKLLKKLRLNAGLSLLIF